MSSRNEDSARGIHVVRIYQRGHPAEGGREGGVIKTAALFLTPLPIPTPHLRMHGFNLTLTECQAYSRSYVARIFIFGLNPTNLLIIVIVFYTAPTKNEHFQNEHFLLSGHFAKTDFGKK